MSELKSLLERITAVLGGSGMPSMIAGSFARTPHGLPRATRDLDIVIDPPDRRALESLLQSLPEDAYYVDQEGALDALRGRSMFNVIDLRSGWKIDFIIKKSRPLSQEEFGRRQDLRLLELAQGEP